MKIQIRNNCSDFNSYRAARVKSLFNCDSGADFALDADLPLEGAGWKIGVVVGPSGSGKTSIGRTIWPDVGIYDGDNGWAQDKPIVECIAPDGGFDDVTGALSAVGLGSVPAWLRPYAALSNGEKFRAGLARVIAEGARRVIIDEFTSVVARFAAEGYQRGTAQDERIATWEPSIDRPPAFRPDLLMIEGPKAPRAAPEPTWGDIWAGHYDETLRDVIAAERGHHYEFTVNPQK